MVAELTVVLRELRTKAEPLTLMLVTSVLFDLATRTVKVYVDFDESWAVTITLTVLLPTFRPEAPITSTVAETSSAVA